MMHLCIDKSVFSRSQYKTGLNSTHGYVFYELYCSSMIDSELTIDYVNCPTANNVKINIKVFLVIIRLLCQPSVIC